VGEAAFDDVAVAVVRGVEGWRPTASCAAALSMTDVV
jgi:hypothetical protein